MIKVGISARFLSRSPDACGVGGKAIQYLEQNMANSLARNGALPFLIPSRGEKSALFSEEFQPHAFADSLDALVLQGGVDISPELYNAKPTSESGVNDVERDRYELALIDAFLQKKKPVLGICRGMQLINVYMGGSLCQDIPTEIKTDVCHLDEKRLESLHHPIEILPCTYLAKLYGAQTQNVSSIHHQCVERLGRDLVIEAVSPQDRIVEAIRYTGDSYMIGLQFHPEFHHLRPSETLDADILFSDLFEAARKRRTRAA